jgi:hypothetical protein
MQENITVDEAIKKGHRMVTFSSMSVMFGTLGLSFFLGLQEILPIWIIPVGFGLSFVFAWLYWSVMITKWRLWAFENVRNVHELKKRAVQEKLIWADNSIFEKTEIRKSSDIEKWSSLQTKFSQEDKFYDDLTIPNETVIYYAKGKNYFEMVIGVVCFFGGVYFLISTDSYIIGTVLLLFGAYMAYSEFKETTNIEPQIILNEKGIQTISTEFYKWSDIENEEAISEGSGKYIHYYLTYDNPDGQERLMIDDFETEQRTLNKLLILYRGRHKNRHQKTY